MSEQGSDSLIGGFEKALNSQGYGFHYAVLKKCEDLYLSDQSFWRFEVTEFPVAIQGTETRIDFILSRPEAFLIAECKRANPALSNWCFIRAPRAPNEGQGIKQPRVLGEQLRFDDIGHSYTRSVRVTDSRDIFQLALELRAGQKGDEWGKGRGAIEDAATQVSRGLNGFVEYVSKNRQLLENRETALFLPVVFTTARLWVSDLNLGQADLATGKVNTATLTEKPWLWYDYPLSPSLKNTAFRDVSPDEDEVKHLRSLMEIEYVRSIAIVSVAGIEVFLKSKWWRR